MSKSAAGDPVTSTFVSNTPSELEREIADTRERLAGTIDQLLYRSHPKTIVSRETAAIKGHYVDSSTGQPRTDNILKTVGVVVGTVVVILALRRATR